MTDSEIILRAQASVATAMNVLVAEARRRGAPPDVNDVAQLATAAADVLVHRLEAALPLDTAQTRTLVVAMLSASLGAMLGVVSVAVDERVLRELTTPSPPRPPEGPPA